MGMFDKDETIMSDKDETNETIMSDKDARINNAKWYTILKWKIQVLYQDTKTCISEWWRRKTYKKPSEGKLNKKNYKKEKHRRDMMGSLDDGFSYQNRNHNLFTLKYRNSKRQSKTQHDM
jgi:hypothetical protein